jgi:hypothetical protein
MIFVTRRGSAVSVLGIAAPICLLAMAWSADRIFHHQSCRSSPRDQPAVVDPGEQDRARKQALDDLLRRYGEVCTRPDGIEQCTPSAIEYTLAGKFRELGVTRSDLERRWLANLDEPVAPFGLAWLGSERALPGLRDALLAERSSVGWKAKGIRGGVVVWISAPPDDPRDLYSDDQFPRHRALIFAIEWISGRPWRDVVSKLSNAERLSLYRDSVGCHHGERAATWLLHKVQDVPLTSTAQNRANRLACEGPRLDEKRYR